jgi:signal transduction histidine kinase
VKQKRKTPDAGRRVAWWQSIRVRLFSSYLFIVAAVLLVLNSYPILAMQNSVFRMKQTSVQNQASVVASALSSLETLNEDEVEQVMNQLDTSGLNRLIVTDEMGMILFDTTKNEDSAGKYALLQEISQALQGKDVFRSDYSEDAFRSRAAVPVVYHGVVIGCVYVYEYDSDQAALLVSLRQNLEKLSVAFVLVAFLISFLVSSSMTRKTAKLLQGIQSTQNGNLPEPVELRGQDEINVLAEEFNEMTQRLSRTEEVRRRFVSDASHELKTPLASIRLLSDSILQTDNMDDATMREFVGDIGEEAERLSRITEKLLALTRLDAGGETPVEPVELRDTIQRVIHMLHPLADQKQIELDTEIQTAGMILANADDLYQIVFNLAENGVKYNHPQGQVKLSLREDGDEVVLVVEDTGIGIPESEREKIFDRFYRVDKARSREAGGTGLGLSIVRDMVKKYHGTIQCGPRQEGGSWFLVAFPKGVEK